MLFHSWIVRTYLQSAVMRHARYLGASIGYGDKVYYYFELDGREQAVVRLRTVLGLGGGLRWGAVINLAGTWRLS